MRSCEIPVCVCRLAVYCVCKGAICFACDLNIQEGDGVVLLLSHGEFDEWMLAVQVEEELLKCCLAVRPNHKSVVNIAEAEGQHSLWCPVQTLP